MEAWFGLAILAVLAVGAIAAVRSVVGAFRHDADASGRAMEVPPLFEVRVRHVAAGGAEGLPEHHVIEGRGFAQVEPCARLTAVAMVEDVTDPSTPIVLGYDTDAAVGEHADATPDGATGSGAEGYIDRAVFGEWGSDLFGFREWTDLVMQIVPDALRALHAGVRDIAVTVQFHDGASTDRRPFSSATTRVTWELAADPASSPQGLGAPG